MLIRGVPHVELLYPVNADILSTESRAPRFGGSIKQLSFLQVILLDIAFNDVILPIPTSRLC